MFKLSNLNNLYQTIVFRFIVTYATVFLTIVSLMLYIGSSRIDEVKYDLRSFNLDAQNAISKSFNNIEHQVQSYAKIINLTNSLEILNSSIEEDTLSMFFNAFYVIDKERNVLVRKIFKSKAYDINFDTPWLNRLSQKRYIISDYLFENKKLKTFFVAYEVSDEYDIVAEVDVEYFNSNLKGFLRNADNVVYVVDFNGNFIIGEYGANGYDAEFYSDSSNVDELFVISDKIKQESLKRKISLSTHMQNYNIFVITHRINSNSILFQASLMVFAMIFLLLYALSGLFNISFTKRKIIEPVEDILRYIKDKKYVPNKKDIFKDHLVIVDAVSELYNNTEILTKQFQNYQARFGYIFEKSPLIILVYDAYTGKIIDASSKALQFYGYSLNEIKTLYMDNISDFDFQDNGFELRDVIEGSKELLYMTHVTKSGEKKDVVSRASMIDLDDKKIIFLIVQDITMQKAIQNTNNMVFGYISEFSNVIMIADAADPLHIKYATKNITKIFGIDYDEIAKDGFDVSNIISTKDRAFLTQEIVLRKKLISKLEFDDKILEYVVCMIKANKEIAKFKVSVKFIKNELHELDNVVYCVSDYQEHEELLQKYEAQTKTHKNLIRVLDVGMWEYNFQDNKIKIDAIFAKMLGYDNMTELLIDDNMMSSMMVDEFGGFASFFDSIKTSQGYYEGDIRLYDVDKNVVWLHLGATNSNDNVISGIVRNVTQTKIALIYQELAAKLFSYSHDDVLILDLTWSIIDVNDEFMKNTGFARDEVIGSNIQVLNSKYNDENLYEKITKEVEKTGQWHGKVWFKNKSGESALVQIVVTCISDSEGRAICHTIIASSTNSQIVADDYLEHVAYHDPLTRLPNRFLFNQKLQDLIYSQKNGKNIAIAYVDLDGFKDINDTYGHKAGDKFLIEFSSRIDALFDEKDMFARIGGDEFVAIVLHEKIGEVYEIVENMLRIATEEITYEYVQLKISASIGVSIMDAKNNTTPENLLEQADWAMYQAKIAGKNNYHVFDPTKDRHFKTQYEDNNKILTALENGEFFMEYQPEIDVKNGKILNYEALIRWQNGDNVVYPSEFLPLTRRQNIADDLAIFSIKTALQAQRDWSNNGVDAGVCVNISMEQLCKDEFLNKFKSILNDDNMLNPKRLQLEIIDANRASNLEHASKFLNRFKSFGVRFTLDDFASRTSSFEALELLPIDKIKIDKHLCSYMFFNEKAFVAIRILKDLSDIFEKSATIKNLKDINTLNVLVALGFRKFQGNFFEKPMPLNKVMTYKFKDVKGLNLDLKIDSMRFDKLRECIMLKEFAQTIITHILNKEHDNIDRSIDAFKGEMLTKIKNGNKFYKEIGTNIIQSLNTHNKEQALHLARLANIMCIKALDISQDIN
ncbi:EAL domain-containing protein [Campylobacter majalis]|uniref:EAL domain-containing protein n=1 Tax=Campylobacter majalis TaxID=2790656 RepID=UPI003D682B25